MIAKKIVGIAMVSLVAIFILGTMIIICGLLYTIIVIAISFTLATLLVVGIHLIKS